MTAIAVATAAERWSDASSRTKVVAATLAALASLSVGWSRLYLDEHWLDDVLGGLSLGAAIGLSAAMVGRTARAQKFL